MLPSLHLNKPSPVLSFPAQWRPPFSRFPCTPVWGQIQPPRQCPSCYLPATDPTLTAVLTQIAFWVLMETKWCLALLTHPISFWACNYLTLKLCCKREVAASKPSLPDTIVKMIWAFWIIQTLYNFKTKSNFTFSIILFLMEISNIQNELISKTVSEIFWNICIGKD